MISSGSYKKEAPHIVSYHGPNGEKRYYQCTSYGFTIVLEACELCAKYNYIIKEADPP